MDMNNQQWTLENSYGSFIVSTKIDFLDRESINTAFATEEMFWAKPLPLDLLETMLAQSVTLGLYEVLPPAHGPKTADSPSSPRDESPTLEPPPAEHRKQVGLARLATDHVTFAYLSDVYILPEYRGYGLAKWMMGCVKEVLQGHGALRRVMLLTGSERLKGFYGKELGMWDMKDEHVGVMSRRGFSGDEKPW